MADASNASGHGRAEASEASHIATIPGQCGGRRCGNRTGGYFGVEIDAFMLLGLLCPGRWRKVC